MVLRSALARPLRTVREDPSAEVPEAGLQHQNKRLQEDLAKARSKAARLEDELSKFVSKRERIYEEKVTQAEKRCERILKEKEAAQAAWRAENEQKLAEVRAAATIMYRLWQARLAQLQRDRKAEQTEAQRQLALSQVEVGRLEREMFMAKQEAQQELERRNRDHQAHVEELTRQKKAMEEKNAVQQQQLADRRKDIDRLTVKGAAQQTEIVKLQEKLADAERREEILKNDSTVKALKERMQRERTRLEREVMEYVGYIVRTSDSRPGSAPDFPWSLDPQPATNAARPPNRVNSRLSPLPPPQAYRAASAPTPSRPEGGGIGYKRPEGALGARLPQHLSPLDPTELSAS